MTVFLFVLKMIGIILLCILLLVLLLLLLLLFYPVTYRFIGNYHEKPNVRVHVHWCFHVVSFRLTYMDSQIQMLLRIFGFPIALNKDSKKQNSLPDLKEEQEDKSKEKTETVDSPKQEEAVKQVQTETTTSEEPAVKDEPKQKKKHTKKHKKKFDFSEWFHNLKKKLSDIKKKMQKFDREFHNPRNRLAVKHLKEEVIRLLKIIMPHRLKLKATFSTGSPDTTGIVLGVLAMFPIGYQNRWKITPDFEAEQAILDGDADIKGKIFLFQVVGIAIRILFDKNCRYLFKKIKS